MKKSLIIIFILIAALFVVSCARADTVKANEADEASETVQTEQASVQQEAVPTEMAAEEQKTEQAAPQQTVSEQPSAQQSSEQTSEQTSEQASEQTSQGCVVEANGYKIEVVKATLEKDYTGKDMITVMMVYTNSNTASCSFREFSAVSASQNGSKLSDSDPIIDMSYITPSTTAISNGQSIPVYACFSVSDTSSPVEVTVSINNFASQTKLASGSCTLALS